jgi:hypothetical protein
MGNEGLGNDILGIKFCNLKRVEKESSKKKKNVATYKSFFFFKVESSWCFDWYFNMTCMSNFTDT